MASHPRMAALIHNDGMEPTIPKGSIAVAEYRDLSVDRWTIVGYRSEMTVEQCAFIAVRDSVHFEQIGLNQTKKFFEEHFKVFGPLRINRVGRVVGLPNETILLDKSGVRIDGALVVVPNELQNIYSELPESAFKSYFLTGAVTIPGNQVFILQDNLVGGNDSRSLGTVKLTSVLGKLNDLILAPDVTAAVLAGGTGRLPPDILEDLEDQHGPMSSWVRTN